MTKRLKAVRAIKPATLETLRQRGMAVEAFAEGYGARDAIMHAGQMVRKMRLGLGLTQTELAKRAGMAQPDISRIEAGLGEKGPSVETLDRLVAACGMGLVMGMRERSATEAVDPAELIYLVEM